MSDSFLLVSLEEDKAKALAQVLSNDTARKILDLLSKTQHGTETQIAKKLNLPLSTVHYNISLLTKASLINDDKFNYSDKGKKVIHYSLSNKYVIIAPKKTEQLVQKLKKFLPVILVTALSSIGIQFFTKTNKFAQAANKDDLAIEALRTAPQAAGQTADSIPKLAEVVQTASGSDLALWFFLGSLFTVIVYLAWELLLKKIKK